MEPTLADLLAQQKTTGYSGDQMQGAGGPMLNPMQAALGMTAMKNIQGMAGSAPQMPMAGSAGVAPRGQQVQVSKDMQISPTIDPRIQMGLAQILFGGK